MPLSVPNAHPWIGHDVLGLQTCGVDDMLRYFLSMCRERSDESDIDCSVLLTRCFEMVTPLCGDTTIDGYLRA